MLCATTVHAEGMRCRSALITVGDRQSEVVSKCGDPDDVIERLVYKSLAVRDRYGNAYREVTVPVTIEEWTYNFGPRRFMRLLRFENGELKDIDTLGYGYR